MKFQSVLTLALCALFVGSLAAQDTKNVTAGLTGAGAPLAIHGYDPVAYFKVGLPTLGSAKFTAIHEGVAFRFSSEENRKVFVKNPTGYLPQFGGFCAFGVTVKKKFDGDPRVFKVVKGKLYFNLNPDIAAMWLKDVPGNIKKAAGYWKKLRTTPAHSALANDELNVSSSLTGASAPLAIHGYDPVAYFKVGLPTMGSAKHTAIFENAAYRFASEANKVAFEKKPYNYLPQYGGFCAFGAGVGKKFDGDPRVFKIVKGKLYLNLNPEIQAMWNKDMTGNIQKANSQWTKIRGKAAHTL